MSMRIQADPNDIARTGDTHGPGIYSNITSNFSLSLASPNATPNQVLPWITFFILLNATETEVFTTQIGFASPVNMVTGDDL